MSQGLPGTDQLAVAARQVLDAMQRKGMIPTVRMATVDGQSNSWQPVPQAGTQPMFVPVVFDGDSQTVYVNTAIGPVLQGDRVIVMSFAQGVNYIMGLASIVTPGWANIFPTQWTVSTVFQCTFRDNRSDLVFITGHLTTVGTKTDGTTIATLPTAYRPTRAQDIDVIVDATVSGGQSPHVNIGTNGVMTVWGCGNASGVGFNSWFSRV